MSRTYYKSSAGSLSHGSRKKALKRIYKKVEKELLQEMDYLIESLKK
jgi:predicted unusual protein kinase regulating ubiquinone biosynthesis (AarF/ABC1/UbiB family)